MSDPRVQVIKAPSQETIKHNQVIFLAGTTTSPDWRQDFIASLSDMPITILDPLRLDWDSSWFEDESCDPFRKQVHWELDMQERADIVVVYFGPDTDAPISLLELGLCARSGKALVACHPTYRKKGNVTITCRKFGLEVVDGLEELAVAVRHRLHQDNV